MGLGAHSLVEGAKVMNAIRSHYISRRVCWALVLVMLSSFMPIGLAGAFAQGTKTALLFPLQNSAENAPSDLGARATSALSLALADVPGFDSIQFSTTSPSVRRAVSEGRVRQVDVEEGSGDIATALVIGAALQVDYIVVGGIQSFTRKEAPAGIEVILSGQMYEVTPNINPATGEPIAEPKVFKAFGVSGASSARARQTANEDPMVREAVRDAATKAAAALSGRAQATDLAARKSANGGYKWVLFALLIGAVALAVNNGNGSAATGPVGAALPPTDLRTKESQGSITLSWREPTGTTLTVLRYQVERAIDGAAFQKIDSGAVGAGTTFFNDFGTLTGEHTYQYRIRTVYTSSQVSVYANTSALIVTR